MAALTAVRRNAAPILALAGYAAIVVGIALVFVPAALVVGGLGLVLGAFGLSAARR